MATVASSGRRGSLSGRRGSFCHGSPIRAALELRTMREQGQDSFPILQSYEQIVGCILETVKAGGASFDDFDRALEAVKQHINLNSSHSSFRPLIQSNELGTPTTMCPSPAIRKSRSYSTGKVTVSLTLDDFLCDASSVPQQSPASTSSVVATTPLGLKSNVLRMADIALGDVIGRGSMGTVYRGMVKGTGQQLAVKVVGIDRDDPGALGHIEALDNEMNILQELDHPRIVRYLGHERMLTSSSDDGSNSSQVPEKLAIFCEYLPGGSIAQAIRQFGPFDEEAVANHTRQILEGLKYLHENRVSHRDLKGDNILLDLNGSCKLADFGCSKKLDVNPAGSTVVMKTMKGSIPWMAPEVIMGEGYGRPADIWALGCVVVEMATGKHPWGKFDNIMQAMYRIAMCEDSMNIPEKLSPHCRDFIIRCVSRNPKLRPTAAELLQHPFLSRAPTLNRTLSTRSG